MIAHANQRQPGALIYAADYIQYHHSSNLSPGSPMPLPTDRPPRPCNRAQILDVTSSSDIKPRRGLAQPFSTSWTKEVSRRHCLGFLVIAPLRTRARVFWTLVPLGTYDRQTNSGSNLSGAVGGGFGKLPETFEGRSIGPRGLRRSRTTRSAVFDMKEAFGSLLRFCEEPSNFADDGWRPGGF